MFLTNKKPEKLINLFISSGNMSAINKLRIILDTSLVNAIFRPNEAGNKRNQSFRKYRRAPLTCLHEKQIFGLSATFVAFTLSGGSLISFKTVVRPSLDKPSHSEFLKISGRHDLGSWIDAMWSFAQVNGNSDVVEAVSYDFSWYDECENILYRDRWTTIRL